MEKKLTNILILIAVGLIAGFMLSSAFNDTGELENDYKQRINDLKKANEALAEEKLIYKLRFDSAQTIIDSIAIEKIKNKKNGKIEVEKIHNLTPDSRRRYLDSLFARAGVK